MSALATVGEKHLGRPLEKEWREGIEHFKPGQYDAVTYGDHVNFHDETDVHEIARLTYVDVMGHACVVLCARPPGGEWRATWLSRAGQIERTAPIRAPDDFKLSDKMLGALAKARAETHEAEGPVAADPSNADMPASPDKEKDRSACSQP